MSQIIIYSHRLSTLDTTELDYFRREGIPVYTQRTKIPPESNVIPRVLDTFHYHELAIDLENLGSCLINTWQEHKYIADFQYYEDIKDLTFETHPYLSTSWMSMSGPYVLKGRTSSRKLNFNRLMYADNKRAVLDVATRLHEDPAIQQQGVIVRKYHRLKILQEGINGLNFSNEFRFFVAQSPQGLPVILSGAYYWDISDVEPIPTPPPEAVALVEEVCKRVHGKVRYFTVDVAELAEPDPVMGKWAVVELNDGQMSGLSYNTPEAVYGNLFPLLS